MKSGVGSDGSYGSKTWDQTPYWVCPRCKKEVDINNRENDYLFCECGAEGELLVKWTYVEVQHDG